MRKWKKLQVRSMKALWRSSPESTKFWSLLFGLGRIACRCRFCYGQRCGNPESYDGDSLCHCALCSVLAGNIGMRIATKANVRTANAAQRGTNAALGIAFSGGAVMGMSVVGLGLLGLGIVLGIFYLLMPDLAEVTRASVINGFALGASSVALFGRVGGGIYTKAADVGADLVGKVEAGIPEDDPRIPRSSPIMSVTMLGTLPVWVPTYLNPMLVPSSLPSPSVQCLILLLVILSWVFSFLYL